MDIGEHNVNGPKTEPSLGSIPQPPQFKFADAVPTPTPKPRIKLHQHVAIGAVIAACGAGAGYLTTLKPQVAPPQVVAPMPSVTVAPVVLNFDKDTLCDSTCRKLGYPAGAWGKSACHCLRD